MKVGIPYLVDDARYRAQLPEWESLLDMTVIRVEAALDELGDLR